ncbi:unnamed protein product, partial [Closterium sp. NIES-54]
DRRIRVYDVDRGWALRKDVIARNLRWTITDTALSPDQRFLVYASITPIVHLVNVGYGSGEVESLANVTDIHEELNFTAVESRRRERSFGIWSLQFSSDGRELIAGSSDRSLYVFDLERNQPILRVKAHQDDVNAVAFADETSQLIYSGSDDRICKVWDRRLLDNTEPIGPLRLLDPVGPPPFSHSAGGAASAAGSAAGGAVRAGAGAGAAGGASGGGGGGGGERQGVGCRNKPVGVLVGHTEGITHLASKGDARCFLTNGKDQTMKLWDIRVMMDHAAYEDLPPPRIPFFQWDYRWMDYPGRGMRVAHPSDQSLMTYRNHHVLQTLIRCYFSPLHSTAQRFVYSGSHDGAVYIFDLLTGKQVAKLKHHGSTVRDCSWHPTRPALASVGWDGKVALWESFHGETPPECKRMRQIPQAATRSQQPPSGRSCLLPAAACLLLAACCRLPAACLLPVCLLAASFRLPAACLLPACCLLPAACCLLPPTCCFLPLPPASYLVPTASCLLPAACYLLPLPPASSFEPDGRPIEFAVWLDDLQLFLLIDAKEGVSLFDYVSGTAVTPAADAPALERSQWQTRDAAARLAIRNHLPITERAHFSQHRTTKRLYDYVVARYSSPATAAIGRLMLPYLFPDLSSFTTAEDLVSHLCATDSRFRATLSAEDHFLALDPTTLTVDDFEKHLLAAEKNILAVGAARGTPRSPLFEGCSPSPLTPSYASAATAHDYLGAEGVRAAHCSFISHFM